MEGLYNSKIASDAIDDAQDNERQSACEFVYDFMLNTYGLKGLAESAVHGIFKKIKQMIISKGIDKSHKVRKLAIHMILLKHGISIQVLLEKPVLIVQ